MSAPDPPEHLDLAAPTRAAIASRPDAEAQQAEFDDVAGWTADAIACLGAEYAVPAACRGTGGPGVLRWLSQTMGAQPGTVLLDVGAGLGGPAAFARQEAGVHPLLVELEAQPCTAARRVFGLSTLRADGTALPLADGSVTLAWSLGTLCTTSRQDDLVAELARALAPGATLGLMVLTTTRGATLRSSTGNVFPTAPGLEQMLGRHGFTVSDRRWADSLAQDDAAWEARAERVEVLVRQRHGTDPAYRRADHQERVLGSLLGSGAVRRYLLVTRRTA